MKNLRAVALVSILWWLAVSPVPAQSAAASAASAASVASVASAASTASAAASTPDNAAKSDCRQADMALAPPASGAAYMLGETLRILAKGACAKGIKDQVAKNWAKPALTLVLDDVEMKGIKPSRIQAGNDGAVVVPFQLVRDSNDDESRKSWDALFFQQHDGYTMKMTVALMMGTDPAVLVADRNAFSLQVDKPSDIAVVLPLSLLAFVLAFVLLLYFTNALRDSRDGPFSLGKSQMAFWGLLVLFSFLGVFFVTGTMERIPKDVLILLGISGTTGLGAVMIGAGKKSVEDVPAGQAAASAQGATRLWLVIEFLYDICNDGNGMSFHRVQVVLWTVVLGGVFIWSVAKTMSMPSFQDTLLVLMGISNGLYLGFKFPEKT